MPRTMPSSGSAERLEAVKGKGSDPQNYIVGLALGENLAGALASFGIGDQDILNRLWFCGRS